MRNMLTFAVIYAMATEEIGQKWEYQGQTCTHVSWVNVVTATLGKFASVYQSFFQSKPAALTKFMVWNNSSSLPVSSINGTPRVNHYIGHHEACLEDNYRRATEENKQTGTPLTKEIDEITCLTNLFPTNILIIELESKVRSPFLSRCPYSIGERCEPMHRVHDSRSLCRVSFSILLKKQSADDIEKN